MTERTQRYIRLFLLCGLGLGAAAGAGAQTAPNGLFSATLRAHVRSERFDIVTSIRGLPLGVRSVLQTMWQSQTLDIAEPGTPFQTPGAPIDATLPTRRMVAAGCAVDNHCLIYYQRGGRANAWLVALFRWTPNETRLEGGGTAPAGLKTIEAVRDALVSGAVKGPNPAW
jgi:hypothetical protein